LEVELPMNARNHVRVAAQMKEEEEEGPHKPDWAVADVVEVVVFADMVDDFVDCDFGFDFDTGYDIVNDYFEIDYTAVNWKRNKNLYLEVLNFHLLMIIGLV
jgi:hypothetical protein